MQITKHFFIVVFLMLQFSLLGQTKFYSGIGLTYGLPINQIHSKGREIDGYIGSSHFNIDLGGYLRFNDKFGLLMNIGQGHQYLRLQDDSFQDQNPGFVSQTKTKTNYVFANLQVQYLKSISDFGRTYLYFNGGISFNYLGKDSLTDTDFYPIKNELGRSTTLYQSYNYNFLLEAGIQYYLSPKLLWSTGVSSQLGGTEAFKMKYTLTNGTQLITEDQLSSKLNYIGIKTSLHYQLAEFKKKEKPLKPQKDNVPLPPVKDTVVKDTLDTKIADREVIVTNKVVVQSTKLIVKIWDHQQIDGDIVSLNLNGVWILENYKLQRKPLVLEIEIKPGDNYFVLHALNLGKYSPNTCAITIDDGISTNKVVLESNLEQSGTIDIIFNPTPQDK
jgi:hypothetical protein